jgi:hypothetical protein
MKQINIKTATLLVAFAGTFAMSTTGCVVSLGNRGTPRHSEETTLGQELIDLKAARDSGALTPDEYEYERRRLLDHRD